MTSTDLDVFVRRTIVAGYSVDRRPIRAVLLGDPDVAHPLLVVGCIHGNETAGIAIARQLIRHPGRGEPEPALVIVPDLNPDGAAAGTRQNADGVDLNRNFPLGWRPRYQPGDLFYQGPRPLSEPESRAIQALILRFQPSISIWFHQRQGLVDLSGGDSRLERQFAVLAGLQVRRLARYGGSVVGWENHVLAADTAFVVELPAGRLSAAAVRRSRDAVLRLANQVQRLDLRN